MRSLTWKLSLAFVVVSIAGVLVAAFFVQIATQRSFGSLVRTHDETVFASQMAAYYQTHGSWDGVQFYANQAQFYGGQSDTAGGAPPTSSFVLLDSHGVALTACHTYHPGDAVSATARASGLAVVVNGQTVGTVLPDGTPPPISPQDAQFLASTNQALIFGSLAALAIALGLGLFLARTLTRPVRALTGALQAMRGGAPAPTVPVFARDELGALTVAFNQMNTDLARANQQRRQMTADIAHDLRTPVTVLSGYLEALRDGVLAPTPERFAILHDEARHLQRLIEDLRTLSLADAGELTLQRHGVAAPALLQRIADVYRLPAEQRQIVLQVAAPADLPALLVDEERLVQVLSNLVSNALRYTPPGGTITLAGELRASGVALCVRDTGSGIAPDALARIFDRFYRADAARTGSQGESGLGLAIAKAIVEAHGGTISAASVVGKGTEFTIVLPDETTLTEISSRPRTV